MFPTQSYHIKFETKTQMYIAVLSFLEDITCSKSSIPLTQISFYNAVLSFLELGSKKINK